MHTHHTYINTLIRSSVNEFLNEFFSYSKPEIGGFLLLLLCVSVWDTCFFPHTHTHRQTGHVYRSSPPSWELSCSARVQNDFELVFCCYHRASRMRRVPKWDHLMMVANTVCFYVPFLSILTRQINIIAHSRTYIAYNQIHVHRFSQSWISRIRFRFKIRQMARRQTFCFCRLIGFFFSSIIFLFKLHSNCIQTRTHKAKMKRKEQSD